MSDSQATPTPPPGRLPAQPHGSSRDLMRTLAALVCAAEALTLVGFCAFYLYELTRGASADAGRAAVSALLIALVGVGLGVMARAWWRGAGWPNTPTVVWNVLLLPVALSLVQSDHTLIGLVVAVVALTAILAAIRARIVEPDGEDPDHTRA
ncbi:hypothetical protein [Nostocoides sp. HKS02]|uniref:hypothetical protein n=1 Tax=Nostocoides sp. HKS02 TaxID=1813880 RepID=UPI0012B46F92|nr:hypothetical protein [Tetrasphaera sp. HKS02]QGN56757.1 hypothetical protein GKE56_01260 [Tetrasphaera sp. HKS02]